MQIHEIFIFQNHWLKILSFFIYFSLNDQLTWGEGCDRVGNGWMALRTQWMWIWANFRKWRTGRPDMLHSMGLQRVGHDWMTELNWTELSPGIYLNSCPLSRWCHSTTSASVAPFSPCLQSFPASGSFPVTWVLGTVFLPIYCTFESFGEFLKTMDACVMPSEVLF